MPPTSSGPSLQQSPSRGIVYFHLFSFAFGVLVVAIVWGTVELLVGRAEPAPIVLQTPPTPRPSATPSPTATPGPMTVFVSGAVHAPGLYTLSPAARIGDAIVAAGGLAPDASADAINQAELLWDGAQVHVPTSDGLAATVQSLQPPAGISGSLPTPTPPNGGAASIGGGLVDVNAASASELESLPGIGPSKAAAIIANRPYSSVEDLGRVPGIGDKTVEQLRPFVVVQ